MGKIRRFTDLNAWKEAEKLVVQVYKITESFPQREVFGLVSQMRRCVVSITSNIAEGFSRQSLKEKIQFYSIALGSVTELQSQMFASRDVGLIAKEACDTLFEQSVVVHKLINGLIKSLKSLLHRRNDA